MHKKYLTAVALSCLLGLTACGGKSANEQAAADAQNINLNSQIAKMADTLARECSRSGVKIGCTTDKARGLIKSDSAFTEAVANYSNKCVENYGAQVCAAGYSAFLADHVADKLVTPVAEQAKQILEKRATAERQAAAAREQAAKTMAEEAARKSKAAAEEAARKSKAAAEDAARKSKAAEEAAAKAASGAKAGEEKLKKTVGEAVKSGQTPNPAAKSPTAPSAVSPKSGQNSQ